LGGGGGGASAHFFILYRQKIRNRKAKLTYKYMNYSVVPIGVFMGEAAEDREKQKY
jgi:hypothetical protein